MVVFYSWTVFKSTGFIFFGFSSSLETLNDPLTPLEYRHWKANFGVCANSSFKMWRLILQECASFQQPSPDLYHYFMALHFLNAYPSIDNLAGRVNRDPKTVRKWIWWFVHAMASLAEDLVSSTKAIPHCYIVKITNLFFNSLLSSLLSSASCSSFCARFVGKIDWKIWDGSSLQKLQLMEPIARFVSPHRSAQAGSHTSSMGLHWGMKSLLLWPPPRLSGCMARFVLGDGQMQRSSSADSGRFSSSATRKPSPTPDIEVLGPLFWPREILPCQDLCMNSMLAQEQGMKLWIIVSRPLSAWTSAGGIPYRSMRAPLWLWFVWQTFSLIQSLCLHESVMQTRFFQEDEASLSRRLLGGGDGSWQPKPFLIKFIIHKSKVN